MLRFPLTPPLTQMKKLLIAAAVLGTLGLTACGDKKEDKANDTATKVENAAGDAAGAAADAAQDAAEKAADEAKK